MGKLLTIEFTYDGNYEVGKENVGQGVTIIPTSDNKYILVHFTVEGDFAEIYDDIEVLLKDIREYYGDEVAKVVENEFQEDELQEDES
jgi:hypothetical protein